MVRCCPSPETHKHLPFTKCTKRSKSLVPLKCTETAFYLLGCTFYSGTGFVMKARVTGELDESQKLKLCMQVFSNLNTSVTFLEAPWMRRRVARIWTTTFRIHFRKESGKGQTKPYSDFLNYVKLCSCDVGALLKGWLRFASRVQATLIGSTFFRS